MKPKNIVLLGFVNKAVEYLDQHMDEETPDYKLSKLKNIDLVALEDELSANLTTSLGSMQSTMTTLLKAGNEAFDEFLDSHNQKADLTQQLNDILDVDLGLSSNKDEKKDGKKELEDLLSFYNLDDKFSNLEEEVLEDTDEIEQAIDQRQAEEEAVLSEEEKMLQQIAENANEIKNNDSADYSEIFSDLEKSQTSELDDIFTQIVNHENNPDVQIQITADEFNRLYEQQIIKIDNQASPSTTVDEESKDENVQELNSDDKNENVQEEPVEETKEIEPTVVENPAADLVDVEENDASIQETEHDEIQDETITEVTYVVNPAVDAEVPDIANEETEEEKPYVSSLINDLKLQMAREDEAQRLKEEKNREIYARISESYPYLPISFIKSVYDLKDSINNEYQYFKNVVVLHRVNFKQVDELQQFAEIVLQHGYQINVDEKQKIVDCFIQLKNKEGKIVANIFTIANQAYLLHGEYEGYRVIEVL